MAKRPEPLRQARQILGAQYAPVDYASKQAAARSRQEQAALNASRQALVGLLQSGVAPAGQMYDTAVDQTSALAQGAAKLLADANPNGQIQADLAQVNAPPEQQVLLARQTRAQFPGQGAVLNIQEGSVPGASLLAQKAAEQGYLAGLPTVAALSGEQSLRGLLGKAHEEQQRFQEQRLQIGSQLPALVNTLTEQAQAAHQQVLDNTYRQQELEWRAREAQLDRAAQAATTPYQAAQIQLERQRLQTERQQSQPTGLDLYKAQTDRLNATRLRQEAVSAAKEGSSPSSQRFTSHQIQEYRGQANTIAQNARYGAPSTASDEALEPISYDQAVREMEAEGIPLKIAVQALNAVYPSQYKVTRRGLKQTGINKRNIKKR